MSGCKMVPAGKINIGIEDKFYYEITEDCAACGSCAGECPVAAISLRDGIFQITPEICIDCGTCSAVCPVGAAHRTPYIRESSPMQKIDWDICSIRAVIGGSAHYIRKSTPYRIGKSWTVSMNCSCRTTVD